MLRDWPRRRVLWYALGFVVLFLSFFINLFGTGPDKWFAHFQTDSEAIVAKSAECHSNNGAGYSGPVAPQKGQQYNVMYDLGCKKSELIPYTPQYGLQSRIISFFAPDNIKALPRYFLVVQALLAALMAIVLLAFVFFVQREFGGVTGPVVFVLLCISDWIVGFSRNMYWVPFLLLLPFIFSFGYYQWFKAKNKMLLFYGIVALLLFVRFLNGYEFATTLVLSVFAPILYYELKDKKQKVWQLWRKAALVLAAGIIGFSFAFFCNVLVLQHYYGSWSTAYTKIVDRAEERSDLTKMQANVVVGFEVTLPQLYEVANRIVDIDSMKDGDHNPIKYALLSFVNYIFSPAVSWPVVIRQPLSVFVSSIFAIGVIAYILLRKIKAINKRTNVNVRSLTALYWIGVLAAFSWLIVMPGHAYPHAHLNPIIFYIPFLLVCYIIIGIAVGRYFPKIK